MSSLTETSLTGMKAAFPTASDPIQGIPMLASGIYLMLHCQCSQMHKTPALATMDMLFCAASPGLYLFFTNKMYPSSFVHILKKLTQSRMSLPANLTMSTRIKKPHMPATKKQEEILSR